MQLRINQCNADKQNLEKKIGNVDKKIPDTSVFVTATVLNTKISKVENKILDANSLVTTAILNTKISEVENKISDHVKYIITPEFNEIKGENFAARLKKANLVKKT